MYLIKSGYSTVMSEYGWIFARLLLLKRCQNIRLFEEYKKERKNQDFI